MCGIFGAAGPAFNASEYDPNIALQLLAHRGPDGSGVWVGRRVILGHLRLAIIDLSERGSQPMREISRGTVLSFNGEIYNYTALRNELIRSGWGFDSDSDTEVVLKGYCQWGIDVFQRLNGMFAIAIYDSRQGQLLLARDHAGIKPLYYTCDELGSVYFASEIKGLPENLRREVNRANLGEYFYYGTTHEDKTLVAGVRKVLPGSVLCFSVESGELRQERYWQLPEVRSKRSPINVRQGPDEANGLKKVLIEAVGRQLVSDRPVGVFLSGGVDSSAIACIASMYHGRKLDMFTARFRSSTDETDIRMSEELCGLLGCQHHVVEVDDRISVRNVDAMLDSFDGPFADAAAIPLTLLSEALPSEIKVILQGDGGDELFGGYPRYRYLRHRERLCRWPGSGQLARILLRHGAHAFPRRWQRFFFAVSESDFSSALARFLTVEFPEDLYAPKRIAPGVHHEWTDPFESHRNILSSVNACDVIDTALALDFHAILPDVFLEKVDRSTMAASIEVRVPFLDRELVEYAATIPAASKMAGGEPKALLRSALRGVVPDFILDSPKRGFGVPYGNWIRGPLLDDVRSDIFGCEIYDQTLAARMLEEHLGGKQDHSFMLWKMFLFARWARKSDIS